MERWRGRTAVVSGASSGIGEALARRLAAHGLKVAALARRAHRLQALEEELVEAGHTVKGLKCDVTSEEDVKSAFAWIDENWGQVDILVNSAGVFPFVRVTENDFFSKSKQAFEVNVLGLMACTSQTVLSMKKYGVTEGHIINVNSVAGHRILEVDGFIPYCASKNAVTVISAMLRGELGRNADGIRVSNISPGLTKSELGDTYLNLFGKHHSILETEDIVDAIEYCLAAPHRVNISEMMIQPLKAQIINEHNVNGQNKHIKDE